MRAIDRKRRAVFLDRDGVLNRSKVRDGKPYAPTKLEDFRLLPGAFSAVQALKRAGFLVIVVTNQPDIGNCKVDAAVVEAMHDKLRARVPVDDIMMCPHRQDAGCDCRKPKPGMLIAAATKWNIDLARSYMVGDRWGDVLAGKAAKCYTVFLDRGYGETRSAVPDYVSSSITSAARLILSSAQNRNNLA